MTKAQRIKNLKAQQRELIRKGCEADARGALGIALSYYREAERVQEFIDGEMLMAMIRREYEDA